MRISKKDGINGTAAGPRQQSSGKSGKVVILGGGPNRIGQGIEFDYCCCHAAYALKEEGIESVMVNCNPETVSTDYDTSDRLYFEPITVEDVLNIVEAEKPMGVIVQFGGQTPLNLAIPLRRAGVNILGTSAEHIDVAEDRKLFKQMLDKLGLLQPENGTAFAFQEAREVASRIGYPVLVRPSYVLGGRAMEIVYDENNLEKFIAAAAQVSGEHPVLIDKFLEDAIEVDVDMIGDGQDFVIGGIMEHIEEAGIHSGDSAMALPPYTLSEDILARIREATCKMGRELNVRGLMNVQFAVKDDKLYVLEVNPRASRTVPFVSKVIGAPLAKLATKIMLGRKLKDLGFTREVVPSYVAVKESVFPFSRFPGVDIILGPEMKSTGEVLGLASTLSEALYKGLIAAGYKMDRPGGVFFSVKKSDRRELFGPAKRFLELGHPLYATEGNAGVLRAAGLPVTEVAKLSTGSDEILQLMETDRIAYVVSTSSKGRLPTRDGVRIHTTTSLPADDILCIEAIPTTSVASRRRCPHARYERVSSRSGAVQPTAALIGATGAVGSVFLRVAEQRGSEGHKLPRTLVRLLGSAVVSEGRSQKVRMYAKGFADGMRGRLGAQVRPRGPSHRPATTASTRHD